jgi:hypothetical protein
MPDTYYISTTGNDSHAGTEAAPWLTFEHAVSTIAAGDTVLIEDGTYEPAAELTLPEIGPIINTTWMSKSEDKSKVIIHFTAANTVTNGWYLRKTNVPTSKTTFKHLTMRQSYSGGSTSIINGGKSGGSTHAGLHIEDCDLYGSVYGIRFAGPASVIQRCKIIWFDNGSGNAPVEGLRGSNTGVSIDSCLFVHWVESIDRATSPAGAVIRNCTIIGHPTVAGTQGIMCGTGGTIFNCAMYSYAAGASYNYGFRFSSTNASNTIRSTVAAGDYDSGEYVNTGAPTVFSPDPLEGQTQLTNDFADKMFVDLAGGDYLPLADGILYQRGYATSFPVTDLNGNPFNDPPSIGCLEDPAPAGGGGGGGSPRVNNFNNLNNLKL